MQDGFVFDLKFGFGPQVDEPEMLQSITTGNLECFDIPEDKVIH